MLIPKMVFTPNSFFISLKALRDSKACSCWLATVRVRVSMKISSLETPTASALFTIFLAISSLFSAVSGIPSSSKVNPIIAAPNFFAKGKTVLRDSSFPFTELMSAFPPITFRAFSMTSGLGLSMERGRSVVFSITRTAFLKALASSIPSPLTFISKIVAPSSACFFASSLTKENLSLFNSFRRAFLPVGFILSPTIIGLLLKDTAFVLDAKCIMDTTFLSLGFLPLTLLIMALVCSGPLPQQLPTIFIPRLTNSKAYFAI